MGNRDLYVLLSTNLGVYYYSFPLKNSVYGARARNVRRSGTGAAEAHLGRSSTFEGMSRRSRVYRYYIVTVSHCQLHPPSIALTPRRACTSNTRHSGRERNFCRCDCRTQWSRRRCIGPRIAVCRACPDHARSLPKTFHLSRVSSARHSVKILLIKV